MIEKRKDAQEPARDAKFDATCDVGGRVSGATERALRARHTPAARPDSFPWILYCILQSWQCWCSSVHSRMRSRANTVPSSLAFPAPQRQIKACLTDPSPPRLQCPGYRLHVPRSSIRGWRHVNAPVSCPSAYIVFSRTVDADADGPHIPPHDPNIGPTLGRAIEQSNENLRSVHR